MDKIYNIKNITELHKAIDLEKPRHPFITIVDFSKMRNDIDFPMTKFTTGFYSITLKDHHCGDMKYGRNYYDFQEGTLVFMAPEQVMTIEKEDQGTDSYSGWGLFFHPDLIRNTSLGQKMDDYHFFSYEVNEALHLSDKEKKILSEIIDHINAELSENIDTHSQSLIVSNIELLLNYCNRFYQRQFITRTNVNKDILSEFNRNLKEYFRQEIQLKKGLPTVAYLASKLNVSPGYLSDLLKNETGKNAQEQIHYYILELAKNKLLGTNDSISEIAFSLGFEYPQYFTRIFKKKIGMTPAEYRSKN